MQISFTHGEIREALVEYLEKQITLAPGQTVSLEFDLEDPTDIIAYVDVLREGQTAKGMPSKGGAGKSEPEKTITNTARAGESAQQTAARKTRGPNKPKADALVEAAEETVALNEPVEVTKVNAPFPGPFTKQAEAPVEAAASEAPVEAPAETPAEVEVEAAAEVEVESPAEAIKSGNSIFPNAGSSAAAAPKPVEATPVTSPKSLFANLTRPTNTPTAH